MCSRSIWIMPLASRNPTAPAEEKEGAPGQVVGTCDIVGGSYLVEYGYRHTRAFYDKGVFRSLFHLFDRRDGETPLSPEVEGVGPPSSRDGFGLRRLDAPWLSDEPSANYLKADAIAPEGPLRKGWSARGGHPSRPRWLKGRKG